MIIVMQPHADETAIEQVIQTIRARGLSEHISRGTEHVIIGAVGDERVFDEAEFERLPQVQKAMRIMNDWRMISREAWADNTTFTIRGIAFGGEQTQFMQALPSDTTAFRQPSVPIPDFTNQSASNFAELPETTNSVLLDPFFIPDNPYAHSGSLKDEEIAEQLIQEITSQHKQNRAVAVRVRDSLHIQAALNAQADLLYLGGEMLTNRHLLHEIGSLNVPTILCKATHHSVRDWLVAAEQIVLRGNQLVILGEAGTLNLHSAYLRLDVDAIAAAKKLSHLPVLANISHLAHRQMDKDTLLRLAQAAGADIIVI